MSLVPESLPNAIALESKRPTVRLTKDQKKKDVDARAAAKEAARVLYEKTFTDGGDTHDRSKFLLEQSTGVVTDERNRRKEGMDSEKVRITENLKTQYKNFLTGLFNSFTELRKDKTTGLLNPDFNGTALDGTARAHERNMYFMLTKKDGTIDEDKLKDYLKDPEHVMLVEEVLEDHMRLRMFGLGLAAMMDPRGKRDRDLDGKGTISMDIDRGVLNKAIKDYVWPWLIANGMVGDRPSNNVHFWERRITKLVAALVAGTATGLVAGPYVGAIAALGTLGTTVGIGALGSLGAAGLGSAFMNLIKQGVHVDVDLNSEVVRSLKGNNAEVAYMKAIAGIDLDDIGFDPHTGEMQSLGHATINREKILGETMKLMYTRTQYHSEIGVDLKDVDAMLEQGILASSKAPMVNRTILGRQIQIPKDLAPILEQTRTRSKARIVEIYIANGGSFDPYPAAQPARSNEVTRRLRILADARVQYMNEIIRRDVQKKQIEIEVANEASAEKDITEKIDARTKDDGRLVKVEREKITKKEADLNEQKTILQEEKSKFEKHIDVRKDVDTKTKEVNDFLADFGIDATTLNAAGLPQGTQDEIERSADEVLRQMLEEDNPNFFTLRIGQTNFGPDTYLHKAEDMRIAKAADIKAQEDLIAPSEQALSGVENTKRTAEDKYQAELERYKGMDELIKGYQDVIAKAPTAKNANTGQIQSMIDMARDGISEIKKEKLALHERLYIGDPSKVPPVKSLSTERYEADSAYSAAKRAHDQLVIAVNQEKANINALYKTQEDKLEAHKKDIEAARTELTQKIKVRDEESAKAQSAEQSNPDIMAASELVRDYVRQSYILTHFVDAAGAQIISDADLRTMSVTDIMKKVNIASTVAGANADAWPESQNDLRVRKQQVLHAIVEERAKAIAYIAGVVVNNSHRRTVIERYVADLDKSLLVQAGESAKVPDTLKAEVAELKVAQDLLKRQTEMLGNNAFAQEFVMNRAPGPDFAQYMRLNPDPRVSSQEKDITPITINGVVYSFGNTERSYFVLLDMLTGYMNKSSSEERGKEFEKWSKVLPPDEMARLVYEHMLRLPVNLMTANMVTLTPVLMAMSLNSAIGPENVINFVARASQEKVRKARALR